MLFTAGAGLAADAELARPDEARVRQAALRCLVGNVAQPGVRPVGGDAGWARYKSYEQKKPCRAEAQATPAHTGGYPR